ncbi:MAG TPA: S1 RNA-binding domain-containing protein, partial [Candidatus Ozemobacteraceae bacterium]|nr:S1 RNA-binding domain-containing protein [Candidatus Ozemobacteraceae bacterium]
DVEVGTIYQGRVQGFATFGSFVQISDRLKGLVHKSNVRTNHEEGNEIRVLPFLIPQNVRGTETPRQYLTSVDRIEQLTGLDFLWALNDPHEKAIEEMIPKNLW